MFEARYLSLIDKAATFVERVRTKEYTPDGKATSALLYQIDAMIYGLAGIDSSVWSGLLKTFKETKNLLRTHSRTEDIKKENYTLAIATLLQALDRYTQHVQSALLPA